MTGFSVSIKKSPRTVLGLPSAPRETGGVTTAIQTKPAVGGGPPQMVLISQAEFTNALLKYIPSLVLQQWTNKADQAHLVLPELQTMETVVLFADISGFTNISEACAKMGVRGNEELAFCINRYMEGMVKSLGKYGGDIIKFVGDAMIVMWPRSVPGSGATNNSDKNLPTQGSQSLDDRSTVVRKAIQCAIDIQNELNNKKIMSNVTNLSVKIGIGFGDCALLYVGGVFNRAEFFTVGDALTQALKSEENATAGGQIIVSQNAWAQVVDFFESEEIIDEHNDGKRFYRILGLIQGIRARAEAVLLRNQVQAENTRIQSKLRACVPAAIMPYLEIGYEQYGSETRRLTVMFASLGIDLSSAKSREGMQKIQKIVTTVQQQVYRMEGSLNKLVMDDKGSTLICIWGLCPFSHEDDAARAILTAMNIRRELLKIENTWCNMGISTGEVFSGVVGTSGSRKEFSVLGDYVNLAARIMYYPKKYKQTGKIYVDFQTKREADNYINFLYKDHCEFKGKSISLPIYEPIDPADEALQCIKKIAPMEAFLKIHSNPFLIDKISEHKKKQVKQIGRDNLLAKVTDELLDFFDEDNQGSSTPYILAVYGEIGSGKTLFARCIADFMRKRKDVFRDSHLGADQKPILMSSLNPESQMKFLNIWRPILQMMLYMVSKRARMPVEDVLTLYLKQVKDDRYAILLDVFGMTQMNAEGEIIPLPLPNDPLQFVKRERYSEEIVDGCLDCIIDFIKIVLGESIDDQEDDDISEDFHTQVDKFKRLRNPNALQNLGGSPCLIILDTVHLMDEPSWRLLELIKDECSKIAIILLVQTDTNNQPKIHPEARSFFHETFGHHTDCIKVIDLPPLKVEDLSGLIQELAPKYQVHMGEDIHLQTYIADPDHSIKNPEVCKQKQADLRRQYMIQEQNFFKINEDVMKLVVQRCEGNPLISLNFLFNLLANDYLVQKGVCLEPTAKFMKCKYRSDWTTVPCAGISLKINSTLLDNFIKEMRAKPQKSEQETSIKGLLLLKCAAVVGDTFGSRVLQHISPLRHETHQQILHILKILEARDLIEILDESDPKNAICRFRKSFLRETIYQLMLYRAQKKGIHQLVVEHIQDNPLSIDQDPEIEAEKLLWHILLAEDLENEDKIPSKSKQGLIVKKIANQILKNPNAVVKRGMLTKQGDKPNKKVEERFMILRSKHLAWYHDQKEFEQGKKPLGVIHMHAIYHCMPAKTEKPTDDLNIGTCAWSKKDVEKEGRREFIFGAENQNQRDEWISCIEYLRTKAIYDSFVSKYCNITFPLRRQSDEIVGQQKQDLIQQLTDFGYKFRSQAMLNKSPVQEESQMGPTHTRHQRGSSIKRGGSGITKQPSNLVVNSTPIIDQNKAQDLAQKIKKLFNISIVSYVSHVQQNANKVNRHKHDSLRRLPETLRNSALVTQLAQEEISLHVEHPVVGQSRLPSFLVGGNQSTLLEDSPLGKIEKLRDMRRMSEIAKKQQHGEDSQVVRFIEDLRSADTPPPDGKLESNSSDHIVTKQMRSGQNRLAPRKSIYSNFTANSQPQPVSGQSQLHTSNSDMSAPVHHDDTADIEKDNQKQKSRISVQIALVNQGQRQQRNLTFQNQEQLEASQQQQQMFNVGKPSQKPRATTALGMEQIEEKEEYDPLRRGSGGDTTQQNDKKFEVTSQTSISEERKTSEENETRRTGKFTQIESPKDIKNVKTTAHRPQEGMTKVQKQKEVKNTESNRVASEIPKEANGQIPQTQNISELISQTIKEQVSKGIQEILQSVTNFTQQQLQASASVYASQTTLRGLPQDPYSPSQRGYGSPRQPLRNNNTLNLSYASVGGIVPQQHGLSLGGFQQLQTSVGISSSNRSSASYNRLDHHYHSNDLVHRLRLKQQNSSAQGGASSSKKLKMEQPMSKGVNQSRIISKGGGFMREIVHEDDEDVVESPEMSPREANLRTTGDKAGKKLSPPKININQESRGTVFDNQSINPEQVLRLKAAQQDLRQKIVRAKSPPAALNLGNIANRSEARSSSLLDQRSLLQQSVQGGAMPSSSQQETSRFDSHSPPSSAYHQNQQFYAQQQRNQQYIQHPQLYHQSSYNSVQNTSSARNQQNNPYASVQVKQNPIYSYERHIPAQRQQQHFFGSPPSHFKVPPFQNQDFSEIYAPSQDQSYIYQDPGLDFMMQAQVHNNLSNQQYHNNSSAMTIKQETLWAIVMDDAVSLQQNNGRITGEELMQLYEGDKVEVLRILHNIQAAEVRLEGLVGIFPMGCLKILNKQSQYQQSPEQQKKVQEQKNKLKLNERKKQKQQSAK